MTAQITGTTGRVGKYLRITKVKVELQLGVAKADLSSLEDSLKVFENYCTVTQSVRAGVEVEVEISDNTGTVIHRSADQTE